MLVFILLTMFMGGLIMLSASLLYLNNTGSHLATNNNSFSLPGSSNKLVYDDVELPAVAGPQPQAQAEPRDDTGLLDFTRTSQKSDKQLPLMGIPDKAFYHIH